MNKSLVTLLSKKLSTRFSTGFSTGFNTGFNTLLYASLQTSFWRLLSMLLLYLLASVWVFQGALLVDFGFCLLVAVLAYIARFIIQRPFFKTPTRTNGLSIQFFNVLLTLVIWFFFSASWVAMYSLWQLDHRLPEAWEKKDLYVHGQVIGLPSQEANRQVFFFQPNALFDCGENYLPKTTQVRMDVSAAKAKLLKNCQSIDLSQRPLPERYFSLKFSDFFWQAVLRKLPNAGLPRKIRVSLYQRGQSYLKDQTSLSDSNSPLSILAGESYQLLLKMRRPRSSLNFEGFDYETWLFTQGIHANGYVKQKVHGEKIDNRLLIKKSSAYFTPSLNIDRYREHIRQQFILLSNRFSHSNALDGFQSIVNRKNDQQPQQEQGLKADTENQPLVTEALALIMALTLGDRSFIQEPTKNTLITTGTFHLLAISGMHIGLLSFFSFVLSLFLVRFFSWLVLVLSRQRLHLGLSPILVASLISCLCAFGYSLLAGFSLPSQRALIMVLCYSLVFVLFKRVNFFNVWLFVMLLVLIWNPFAIFSAGFYLSFGAVLFIQWVLVGRYQFGSIILSDHKNNTHVSDRITSKIASKITTGYKGLRLATTVQLVLFLGMMPWLLFFFNGLFPLALVANFFAIPLVSFLILPISLLLSVFTTLVEADNGFFHHMFNFLLSINESLLLKLMQVLRYLESIDLSGLNGSGGSGSGFVSLSWEHAVVWTIAVLVLFSPLISRFKILLLTPLFCIAYAASLKESYKAELDMPPMGEFRLDMLDVSQGLALIIETQNHRLIYDTGPAFGDNFDAGSAAVIPAIRAKLKYQVGKVEPPNAERSIFKNLLLKRKPIDLLLLSHSDKDHIGGALSILKTFPHTDVLAYSDVSDTSQQFKREGIQNTKPQSVTKSQYFNKRSSAKERLNNYKHERLIAEDLLSVQAPSSWKTCQAGKHWQWDGVSFEVLHPSGISNRASKIEGKEEASSKKYSRNNASCVLLVKSKQLSLLITGDIESQAERLLVESYGSIREGSGSLIESPGSLSGQVSKLAADILIAPHHGSNSSSKADFIDAVNPSLVLISAGFKNQFNHPHPKVLARYKERKIKALNTAQTGGISLETWRKPQGFTEQNKPRLKEVGSRNLLPTLAREELFRFWRF